MAEGSSGAVWFGAPGFEVLDVVAGGDELVIEVQTTAGVVGCGRCGVRARSKDRRWVTLRDVPVGDVAVRVRWRKRVWVCVGPGGDVGGQPGGRARRALRRRSPEGSGCRGRRCGPDPDCGAKTWTERSDLAAPRRVLGRGRTSRAARVGDPARVGPVEMPPPEVHQAAARTNVSSPGTGGVPLVKILTVAEVLEGERPHGAEP